MQPVLQREDLCDHGGGPPRRAVVTGGAGFLGSHLCEALLDGGTEVVCLDSFLTGSPANVAHLVAPGVPAGALRPHRLRARARTRSTWCCTSPHRRPRSTTCSCRSRRSRSARSAPGTRWGWPRRRAPASCSPRRRRSTATRRCTRSRRTTGGTSTRSGPRGVYDEAKRFGEAHHDGLPRQRRASTPGIVRIFNTYGPRMRPHDGRAIPTFIRQALAGEPLTVAGDGSQTRSVCFVDDLVARRPRLRGAHHPGPVNIGNPEELTVRQIAEDVVAAAGSSSDIVHVDRPVDDPQVRRPDTTLAARAARVGSRRPVAAGAGPHRGVVRRAAARLGLSRSRRGRSPLQQAPRGVEHLVDPGPGEPHVDIHPVRVARWVASRGCQITGAARDPAPGPSARGPWVRTAAPRACRTPWRGGPRRCRRRRSSRAEATRAGELAEAEPAAPVLHPPGAGRDAGTEVGLGRHPGDGHPVPLSASARTTAAQRPAGHRRDGRGGARVHQHQVLAATPGRSSAQVVPVARPAGGGHQPAPAVDLVLVRVPRPGPR